MGKSRSAVWVLAACALGACSDVGHRLGGKYSAAGSPGSSVDAAGGGAGGRANVGGGPANVGGGPTEPFLNGFGCPGIPVDAATVNAAQASACGGYSAECEMAPSDWILLVDRSAIMNESWGGSSRWKVALDGIASFLSNLPPIVSVGLQTFSSRGSGDAIDCSDATYATPVVDIGSGSVAGPAIDAALQAQSPAGPATLGPALRGTLAYARAYAAANPTYVQVTLITSGATDACGSSLDALVAQIGNAPPSVGVIGLGSGTDVDALAAVTGGRAFLIGPSDGSERVRQALEGILTDQGRRSCDPKVFPNAPFGAVADYSGMRVFVRSGSDDSEVPRLASQADCAASAVGGWYVAPGDPSRLSLCSCTCAYMACGHDLDVLTPCVP